jgi:hypothetical protein
MANELEKRDGTREGIAAPAGRRMTQNVSLRIASLLSVLLTTFHIVDDVVYRISPGGLSNLTVVAFCIVWLYAVLILDESRIAFAIVLLMAFLASAVPILHMRGKSGITAGISNHDGAFFFAWTALALEVTGVFSFLLALRGLLASFSSRRISVAVTP